MSHSLFGDVTLAPISAQNTWSQRNWSGLSPDVTLFTLTTL